MVELESGWRMRDWSKLPAGRQMYQRKYGSQMDTSRSCVLFSSFTANSVCCHSDSRLVSDDYNCVPWPQDESALLRASSSDKSIKGFHDPVQNAVCPDGHVTSKTRHTKGDFSLTPESTPMATLATQKTWAEHPFINKRIYYNGKRAVEVYIIQSVIHQ